MGDYHFEPHSLILVTGIPGSGKRTLIERLVQHIHVTYIDSDKIKDIRTTLREGEFYEKIVRQETYMEIDSRVMNDLKAGNSVLVRATYSTEVKNPNWIDRYVTMTQDTGSQLKLIRCVAPEYIIRQRLEKRDYERDKSKLKDWKGFLEREPIHVPMPDGSIELDTSNGLEQCVEISLGFLKNGKIF